MSQRRERDAYQSQSHLSTRVLNLESAEPEIFGDSFSIMKDGVIDMAQQYANFYKGAIPEDVKMRLLSSMKDIILKEIMVEKISESFVQSSVADLDLDGIKSFKQMEKALEGVTANTKKQLEDDYKNSLASNDAAEDHPSIVLLKSIIADRNEGDDGGDEAGEEEMAMMDALDEGNEVQTQGDIIPVLDPISKTELTDPIKNRVCGHIYGQATMMQLLEKQRIRCPTMGCSNRQYIRKEDLVLDKDLTRRVKKRMAKQRSQQ